MVEDTKKAIVMEDRAIELQRELEGLRYDIERRNQVIADYEQSLDYSRKLRLELMDQFARTEQELFDLMASRGTAYV